MSLLSSDDELPPTHGRKSRGTSRTPRSRRTSTASSTSSGDRSGNTSMAVNRSSWTLDDEEQAELERMAAEFDEAEKLELSVELGKGYFEYSESTERSLLNASGFSSAKSTSTQRRTPSSFSRSEKVFRTPSTAASRKRKSLSERLADDFTKTCKDMKHRSKPEHEEENGEVDNEYAEKPPKRRSKVASTVDEEEEKRPILSEQNHE